MDVCATREKSLVSSHAGMLAFSAAAAATALWVEIQARRAEHDSPPQGKFAYVDGARLHYVVRGEGPPVVLLHGNHVALGDFQASGLIDRLARHHRVIAFDRPGYGHSSRPRDRRWTASAQAALLHRVLPLLDIERPVVVGHSFGCLVALAMSLDYPAQVGGLVLVGGYYYPALRLDALRAAPVALPVLGDIMRHTVTALARRAMLDATIRSMFAPNDVPPDFFGALSREMMLRPAQLRAHAEDAAWMMAQTRFISRRYHELRLPIAVVAGQNDRLVDVHSQSARLHLELPHSELHVVPHTGHMAHYVAQELIAATVDRYLPALKREVRIRTKPEAATAREEPEIAGQS